ncbi:TPR repeat-containing protein [Rhodopirellula baltica SH28]|uniref:TPR repeat-containing protein n=1 Tax=Rhodopirellula baltica SH28 TaxID=993517 RepID=K5DLU8_RHOBT|nr:TPR repeat-containing protein [Rhodopirellula baltica SH28]
MNLHDDDGLGENLACVICDDGLFGAPEPAAVAAVVCPFQSTERWSFMSRREKIEAMLADDPTDTFLRYSLAMEYRSEGDHETSLVKLRDLFADDPPYVPAFFMAAQQLVDLGRIDEARAILRDGIEQARTQNDSHAAAEMSELLSSIGMLGEDDDL